MFLVNGQKAILRQYNRTKDGSKSNGNLNIIFEKSGEDNSVFDDQNFRDVYIKCIPYNVDYSIRFSEYTVPNAKGYYQVPNWVDVRVGDQIRYLGKFGKDYSNNFETILEVRDGYLFNNVENKIIAVK